MLTEEQIFRRKQVIKAIVELPEFDEAIAFIKSDIANEIFTTENRDKREALYNEASVVELVRGRFVKLANDVRMIKNAT